MGNPKKPAKAEARFAALGAYYSAWSQFCVSYDSNFRAMKPEIFDQWHDGARAQLAALKAHADSIAPGVIDRQWKDYVRRVASGESEATASANAGFSFSPTASACA